MNSPRMLTAPLALLLLLISGAQAQVPDLWTRKEGHDWPGFLGPNRDSVSAEKMLTAWPPAGPPIVWQMEIGQGYVAPTVVKGRLLHFHRKGDIATLDCLNAQTGAKIWQYQYPTDYRDMYGYDGGPRTQPHVDDDRVYLYGPEGQIHCVNLADGAKIWSVDTVKQFGVVQNFFGAGSAPVVHGDLLIAMVGGSPADSPSISSGRLRGNGSGIVAFDKRTGQVKYKLSDELASYSSLKAATFGGKPHVLAFMRGGLLAFDPVAGKELFHYPWRARSLESVNASTPVVWDDRVFISETYGPGSSLLKVTPDKPPGHEVVWKDTDRFNLNMQTHWNTAIKVGPHLYGSSGRHRENAELRCIVAETGQVRWSLPDLTRCSLLLADGHFICQAESGRLLLIKPNPAKYEPIADILYADAQGKPLLQEPAWAAPVLSHGYLYVRGRDRLLCLDVKPN